MTCDMRGQTAIGFAFCATHDTTFPLGAICPVTRDEIQRDMVRAWVRGRFIAYRKARRQLARDDRARGGRR